mgnify:CR=1 FL=1
MTGPGPIRPLTLVALATIAFALTLLTLRWAFSRGDVIVPAPIIIVLLAAFAVIVVALGWRVRSFVAGKVSMDAVAASRVAALAQSAAYVGALGIGLGLGQVAAVADRIDAPAARSDALVGGATGVAALALIVAALVAQNWCRVPKDDDHRTPPSGPTAR